MVSKYSLITSKVQTALSGSCTKTKFYFDLINTLLFYVIIPELAKARQNEFAVLFDRFASKGAQRIEEYPGGLLIGLGCFSKSELKFCFGHL